MRHALVRASLSLPHGLIPILTAHCFDSPYPRLVEARSRDPQLRLGQQKELTLGHRFYLFRSHKLFQPFAAFPALGLGLPEEALSVEHHRGVL